MEILKDKTPTELLKLANDLKKQHEKIKKEILDKSELLENIEKEINGLIDHLTDLEKQYVAIVEEIDRR